MAISQDQAMPRFRFRVSTALVCFGLVFLPWSAYFFDRPKFLDEKGLVAATFNFVVYHFSGVSEFLCVKRIGC
jgi:hypothetical protein